MLWAVQFNNYSAFAKASSSSTSSDNSSFTSGSRLDGPGKPLPSLFLASAVAR